MRLERVLHVVNCHTEGVVCDVLVGGLPPILGETMMDKRHYFEQHLDHVRRMLLLEPRASLTRSVNVLVPATDPRAVWGFLVLETDEIADMSGGNTIGVATVLLETGLVDMQEPVTSFALDTPAGLIDIDAQCRDGKVLNVTFTNQPAFVAHRDVTVTLPGRPPIRMDVAWGGMWYGIVDAADVDIELEPSSHKQIVELGEEIKAATRTQLDIVHPENPALGNVAQGGVQCTMFVDPVRQDEDGNLLSRNAVVVSPGWIDRCACGTGTSARLALLTARGQIAPGQKFIHESLIKTIFVGEVVGDDAVAGIPAVVPKITGRAWITGTSQVGADPTDPFPYGFSMDTLAAGTVTIRSGT